MLFDFHSCTCMVHRTHHTHQIGLSLCVQTVYGTNGTHQIGLSLCVQTVYGTNGTHQIGLSLCVQTVTSQVQSKTANLEGCSFKHPLSSIQRHNRELKIVVVFTTNTYNINLKPSVMISRQLLQHYRCV